MLQQKGVGKVIHTIFTQRLVNHTGAYETGSQFIAIGHNPVAEGLFRRFHAFLIRQHIEFQRQQMGTLRFKAQRPLAAAYISTLELPLYLAEQVGILRGLHIITVTFSLTQRSRHPAHDVGHVAIMRHRDIAFVGILKRKPVAISGV